jgi:hypothetical protein
MLAVCFTKYDSQCLRPFGRATFCGKSVIYFAYIFSAAGCIYLHDYRYAAATVVRCRLIQAPFLYS